ncbi:TspO/MBR family protein [Tautonia sp. JC769]|uniref:TspO/MBR family protein n=1 Tax=Tautonia sp. JC769 TaxID=3232135 RepID=UPI00345A9874
MNTAAAPVQSPRPESGPRAALGLVGFLVACFAAAGIGGVLTGQGTGPWYDSLAKPRWTPPSALFGPVWTALYAAMAVAAWLVWRRAGWSAGGRVPLVLFAVQLALNVAWSGLFFGLKRPDLAAFEIAILWVAILATLIAFFRVSRPAGWLMVPYLLWVTFASALNLAIWQLNAS